MIVSHFGNHRKKCEICGEHIYKFGRCTSKYRFCRKCRDEKKNRYKVLNSIIKTGNRIENVINEMVEEFKI